MRNLPKFAAVTELKQFLLENYSVELSPAINHSFTVGYMSEDGQSAISKQTNNASERLLKCKSVNSSDVSQHTTGSYRLWSSPDNQVYTSYCCLGKVFPPTPSKILLYTYALPFFFFFFLVEANGQDLFLLYLMFSTQQAYR